MGKIEPFLFGFDTLSISDSVTYAFTNLSTSDLDDDISSAENIGWVVKHSDLMNVFFQEIDNYENIVFMTPKKLLRKKYYLIINSFQQEQTHLIKNS